MNGTAATTKKAVILAAGLGSRLRPFTNDIPKCLLRINSRVILEHQIENLNKFGIKEITMVVGYKADEVKNFVREQSWNINLVNNNSYSNSENLFSLWLSRETFDEGFICLNSEVIFDAGILLKLLKNDADLCAVVDKRICQKSDMKVMLRNDRIVKINKTMPLKNAYGKFMGIIRFSKKGGRILLNVLSQMPANVRKSAWLGFGIQKLVDNNNDVYIVNTDGLFCTCIDFVEDVIDTRRHFQKVLSSN